MKLTTRDISLMGLYSAIFLIMGFVPYLGFIAIGPISITTLMIPFFTIIFLHKTLKYALFAGLIFGFTSLLIATIRPLAPSDIYFVNPLISVLPRIIFGLVVWVFLKFGFKLLGYKNKNWIYILSVPIILISCAIHTSIVLLLFFAFASNDFGQDVAKIFTVILSFNFLIELSFALVTIPFLYQRVKKIKIEDNQW